MLKVETKFLDNLGLDKLKEQIQEEVAMSGVAAMALVLYEEVRQRVPVKTGLLKEAIYRTYSKDQSTGTLKTYHISWNHKKAPHGHLVEFGSSRSAANPFLRPAFDARGRAAIEAGRRRMRERLEELNKGKG